MGEPWVFAIYEDDWVSGSFVRRQGLGHAIGRVQMDCNASLVSIFSLMLWGNTLSI